jgi:sec-independent protein translocase protein TatA
MFNIGPQELLLILLVALVIVGPKRLPEISRTIGRGLREFRKAQDEVTKTIRLGLDDMEPPTRSTADPASPASASGAATSGDGPSAEGQGPSSGPPTGEVTDVARTLGRGLAEIRRTRREIQRTFRIDLTDPDRSVARPGSTSAPADQRPDPVPQDPPAPERADDPPSSAGTG